MVDLFFVVIDDGVICIFIVNCLDKFNVFDKVMLEVLYSVFLVVVVDLVVWVVVFIGVGLKVFVVGVDIVEMNGFSVV